MMKLNGGALTFYQTFHVSLPYTLSAVSFCVPTVDDLVAILL